MNSNERDDNPEHARAGAAQGLLIPNTPRAVCEHLGLNWWAALKLWDNGWLSFDPDNTPALDEAQEQELRFVGSLVARGCDPAMLRRLLHGLTKPYSYRSDRMYYDWASGSWRLLPGADPESICSAWIDELKEQGDRETLSDLAWKIKRALKDIGPPDETESESHSEKNATL